MEASIKKNISIIPAKPAYDRSIRPQMRTLRVATYCRVSTLMEQQESSYEAQVQYYTEKIKSNPNWKLAGIYADDGKSATSTRKRADFQSMIDDCMAGKIDMVITKSISRFARNTVDSLTNIRKLKEKNIAVFFEKEGINTLEGSGELLITILSSQAQEESRNISENCHWGIVRRFEVGQVIVNHNKFLGYTKDKDGNLVVVPEEAELVRRIYRLFLEGNSSYRIKRILESEGIRTVTGNTVWQATVIDKMLTNEKYMGDALLQKTYTVDFLNKKRVKNDGIAPQYYVENNHEAIIPKEIFMRVGEEMYRRANMVSGKGKRRIYSSKYALSSIVYCSKCGDIYRRIAWNNRGKKYTVWRCCTRVTHGPDACHARTIKEEDLQEAVVEAINKLISESNELKEIIKENIEKAITGDGSSGIEEIDKEMLKVQEELLKVANAKKDYTDLAGRVEELRNEKEKILLDLAEEKNEQSRLKELEEFLDNQELEIESYDEDLVRKLVDKVVVYDEELKIVLKSGVEVNVCV